MHVYFVPTIQEDSLTSTNHICLAEWNDISKSQAWVNFFALSLSNPYTSNLFSNELKFSK
jgi:hypothetical protein